MIKFKFWKFWVFCVNPLKSSKAKKLKIFKMHIFQQNDTYSDRSQWEEHESEIS
jgi:hypothetical protein